MPTQPVYCPNNAPCCPQLEALYDGGNYDACMMGVLQLGEDMTMDLERLRLRDDINEADINHITPQQLGMHLFCPK